MNLACRAADILARAAGWTVPEPDARGRFTFLLLQGLQLHVGSPDGQCLLLQSILCALPKDGQAAESLLEKAFALSAAVAGRRFSQLSLTPASATGNETLQLHRRLEPEQSAHLEDCLPTEARALLRDMLWWRDQLGLGDHGGSAVLPESFFSLPLTGYGGGVAR